MDPQNYAGMSDGRVPEVLHPTQFLDRQTALLDNELGAPNLPCSAPVRTKVTPPYVYAEEGEQSEIDYREVHVVPARARSSYSCNALDLQMGARARSWSIPSASSSSSVSQRVVFESSRQVSWSSPQVHVPDSYFKPMICRY